MKSNELSQQLEKEKNEAQDLKYQEEKQGYKYIDEQKQHLHTFDGKPLFGTSTVVGVLAKPLTWWASGLAVAKFGWLNSKEAVKDIRLQKAKERKSEISEMSDEEYLSLLDEAYKAHSVKLDTSAQAGTDMHAMLEGYIKKCISQNKREPMLPRETDERPVQIFAQWAVNNVKRFIWSEANCYSERLWVGGISDVGAEMVDNTYAIIDFKSSKEAYESQFIQCAGYAIQIEENGILTSDGKVLFKISKPISKVIIFPFGSPSPKPEYRMNIQELKQAFEACTLLHKLLNK